jgi:hypothetical protein
MASLRRRALIAGGWSLVATALWPWRTASATSEDTFVGRIRRSWDSLWYQPRKGPLTEAEVKEIGEAQTRRAAEQEARQVASLYSTRSIRFTFGKHRYEVSANYFGPKDFQDWPKKPTIDGFGFFLFRPDYAGYTKENWRDPFDRRKITVVWIEQVEKNAIGIFTDGTRRPLSPDRFDPRVRFESARSLLEEKSVQLYGLTVYRNRGGDNTPGAVWAGHRSNGEFFWFRSSLAPGQAKRNGYPPNPLCDVRYYSEKEDLSIVYRYSQDHVADWREIDDAIWAKIHQWRVA